MYFRTFSAALIVAALSACATTDQEVANSQNSQTCERSYALGSNIPKVVCGPTMTEDEHRRQIDDLRNIVKPSRDNAGAKGG